MRVTAAWPPEPAHPILVVLPAELQRLADDNTDARGTADFKEEEERRRLWMGP